MNTRPLFDKRLPSQRRRWLTLREIARGSGMSASRVRRIHDRALAKLAVKLRGEA